MLRTALKPRWLGLFAVLVLVVLAFTRLGLWQLSVAQNEARRTAAADAAQRPAVPIADAVAPHAPFPAGGAGRRVLATGTYAADSQFLVAPRRLDGVQGYWVVAPLRVQATGATLAVVRGFTRDPAGVPDPPPGVVTLTGALAPGESPAEQPGQAAGASLPVRGALDLAEVVNEWPGDLYNAFAFAVSERSGGPAGPETAGDGLTRVPPPPIGETGLSWRNAAYALQWWIFAAFAAYMWFRMVRDDHERHPQREETDV